MNKRFPSIVVIMATVFSTVSLLMILRQSVGAARLLAPDVPQSISYQGRLTDLPGNPLTGDYDMRFCLYSEPTGGTALWCETHATVDGTAVSVSYGVFNVLLGSITPLPYTLFDGSVLYLGVKVEGDDEMTPRRRVVSVGYAYRAESAAGADTVDGMHASDLASANHTHPDITGVPSGLIAVFDSGSCPAGWTRVAELDGKFLVGGEVYNASAGGSNAHSHTIPNHSHDFSGTTGTESNVGMDHGGAENQYSAPHYPHTHDYSGATSSWSGTTGTADNRPEFATVLLCKKD